MSDADFLKSLGEISAMKMAIAMVMASSERWKGDALQKVGESYMKQFRESPSTRLTPEQNELLAKSMMETFAELSDLASNIRTHILDN